MQYESLYKLRYKAPQEYESIYHERFAQQDTIHLDFMIGEHPAFICQNMEMLHMIIRIHKADKTSVSCAQSFRLLRSCSLQ